MGKQNVVVKQKVHILVSSSGEQSYNSYDFLSAKNTSSIFSFTEGSLGGFRMGAGHQNHAAMIRSLEFSTPPPSLRNGRRAGE